jgi:hypothetical protein
VRRTRQQAIPDTTVDEPPHCHEVSLGFRNSLYLLLICSKPIIPMPDT